jgi:hypothetical protein
VRIFYRTSTAQTSGEGFAQTKVNALGFIAKTSVRNRLEKQRQLEAQEEERAQRQTNCASVGLRLRAKGTDKSEYR